MATTTVPTDLVNDIFLRLPTKSLMRFKCVSKSYCALIERLDFIKSHLQRSLETRDNHMILLKGPLHLYSVRLFELDSVSDVDHPLKRGGPTEVFGSCDGLIGLSNGELDLAIYNPSTREVHRLPVCTVDFPEERCIRGYVFYGFGRDSVSDDYKVLRMVQFKRDSEDEWGCLYPYDVKVYSLKNDSWKKVTRVPLYIQFLFYFYYHLFFRRGYGVLAANNLHWVLPKRPGLMNQSTVFGFNLGSEEFHMIPQPEYGCSEADEIQLDLGVLDDCLCIMCNHGLEYVDVWMMKEYGVKDSWTNLFKVKRPGSCKDFRFLKPLIYSKDGDKVLLEVNNTKLAWFDLKTKKLRSVKIKDGPTSFSAEVVVSSLVGIVDGDRADQRRKQRQEKDVKNKKEIEKRDAFLSEGFKLVL